VIGCKFPHNIVHAQYYANEGCKTCASVAGLVASFIVVVIRVLTRFGFAIPRIFRVTVRCPALTLTLGMANPGNDEPIPLTLARGSTVTATNHDDHRHVF